MKLDEWATTGIAPVHVLAVPAMLHGQEPGSAIVCSWGSDKMLAPVTVNKLMSMIKEGARIMFSTCKWTW